MWADYNYYKNSWAGRLIPAQEYDQFALKAQRFIDYVTQHRIGENITNQVKNAVCSAAEAAYEVRQAFNNIPQGVKSESTDGHSVSYTDTDIGIANSKERTAMYNALKQELSGTGLLFRGVYNAN